MDRLIYCPRCGQSMMVEQRYLATEIECPHCGHIFSPRVAQGRPADIPDQAVYVPAGSRAPGMDSAYPRSRVAAGLLGIFFGGLGVHRFYLGYTGIGMLQLCLTLGGLVAFRVFFCCVPIVSLWGFIEGILCLAGSMKDAQGRRLV